MTSFINNLYATIKYGWPVIFVFFFFMAVAILGFYIYDEGKNEYYKEGKKKKGNDLKMKYVIGGLSNGQEPIYLAGYDGSNRWKSLAARVISSCSKCLKSTYSTFSNMVRVFFRTGDQMPFGEKVFANIILQIWVVSLLTIRVYASL